MAENETHMHVRIISLFVLFTKITIAYMRMMMSERKYCPNPDHFHLGVPKVFWKMRSPIITSMLWNHVEFCLMK
jgi:hypothetical protein